MFSRALAAPLSLGDQIVADIQAEGSGSNTPQTPSGKCYAVAYSRANGSGTKACGQFPKFEKTFKRIWESAVGSDDGWMKLPDNIRGAGPAGALSHAGWGDLVSQTDIWAGKLKPGALIQIWNTDAVAKKVKEGKTLSGYPEEYGHAFIFLSYEKANGKFVGMHIADQGTSWSKQVVAPNEWAWWIASNPKCK